MGSGMKWLPKTRSAFSKFQQSARSTKTGTGHFPPSRPLHFSPAAGTNRASIISSWIYLYWVKTCFTSFLFLFCFNHSFPSDARTRSALETHPTTIPLTHCCILFSEITLSKADGVWNGSQPSTIKQQMLTNTSVSVEMSPSYSLLQWTDSLITNMHS